MDHVDGGAVGVDEFEDDFAEGFARVGEREGDGAFGAVDDGCVPARAFAQVFREEGRVAQRGGEEDVLGRSQLQEGDLPCPPALGIAVEVELVGDEHADVRGVALAQCDVRDDFRRCAHDRRPGVDGRVTRDHAHVVRAEDRDELEELFRDEGFERRRVVGAPPVCEGGEDRRERDHRLARSRRRGNDQVVA